MPIPLFQTKQSTEAAKKGDVTSPSSPPVDEKVETPSVVTASPAALYDNPHPLFERMDQGLVFDQEATTEEELDYTAFANCAPPEVLKSFLTPPSVGGGGSGGVPVGTLPFVAEDYGMAGSPDSNLAPQLMALPVDVSPEPVFLMEDIPESQLPPPEVTPPVAPTYEPVGLPDPNEMVDREEVDNPSSPSLEDPSKDDDVSDPFEDLIYLFLMINRSPSDEQMHMLAAALGVNKNRLEECIFRILRELLVDRNGIDALSSAEYSDENTSPSEDGDEDFTEEANDDINLEDLDTIEDDETALTYSHSPILNPQTEDEMMANDGQPMSATEFEEPPIGLNDGLPA
jgi:hypothetical protein